jgi:molybdopterin-guanine dinucleotide biosynthesis protein A
MGGTPKGLETIGGVRIIDRVVSALQTVTSDIVLSANRADASKWLMNVAILSDRTAGIGGISGILSALSMQRNVLVVAWDMPFVAGDLLNAIATAGVEHGADAAIPESHSPHGIEPFCAWYAASAHASIERFLAGGGRSAWELVSRLPRVHRVPLAISARFGDPDTLFLSVNTPRDLARARAIAETLQ